jgi:hypothetical protein
MQRFKRFFKRFGTDIAGYVCLILVLPVGSLPGPGGIPLLIAGLSLLSIHNAWAQKLLDYVKERSDSLRGIFFPKNKTIELLWDVGAGLLFVSAFVVSIFSDVVLLKIMATAAGAIATTTFLFNRQRLEAIHKRFKKR